MRQVTLALLVAVVVALFAIGCGTSSSEGDVPPDSVAVVGDRTIKKSEFEELVKYAKRSYAAQKRDFPKNGTPEYKQISDQAVRFLVQRAQFEVKADDLNVDISDEAVDKRVNEYKKERHKGSDEKFRAELKQQGLTEEQARDIIRANLVQEAIYNKVTSDVKVDDKELRKYYDKNKAQYATGDTRLVRHVLVKKKGLADRLYNQLRGGGDWKAIAKRHSEDPGSKDKGGRYTATKGQVVPEFEKTTFSIKTNQIAKPVKTQFGWHIIEATSAVKPKATQELSDVESQISDQLLEEQKNARINEWIEELRKRFEDEVAYAPGFEPPPAETTTGAGDTGGVENEPAPDTSETGTETE
jgi:parvulin-like peptidyl-prolyl isomerase